MYLDISHQHLHNDYSQRQHGCSSGACPHFHHTGHCQVEQHPFLDQSMQSCMLQHLNDRFAKLCIKNFTLIAIMTVTNQQWQILVVCKLLWHHQHPSSHHTLCPKHHYDIFQLFPLLPHFLLLVLSLPHCHSPLEIDSNNSWHYNNRSINNSCSIINNS